MWGPATEKALGVSTDMLGKAATETDLVGKVAGKYWPEVQDYVSVELEGIILETEAVKLLFQRKNGVSVQCSCYADSHGLISCRWIPGVQRRCDIPKAARRVEVSFHTAVLNL